MRVRGKEKEGEEDRKGRDEKEKKGRVRREGGERKNAKGRRGERLRRK